MKAAALVLLSSSVLAGGYGELPLAFEVNQGQTDAQVKYLARGEGYALFLTGSGAVLKLGGAVVRMRLVGANARAQARGLDRLPGKSHYFTGKDPAQWRSNIAQYARVRFEQVYPGISLVYYGNQRHLEYDFVVAPGADPGRVQLEFQGVEKVRVDSGGDLLLRTAAGEVRQRKPLVLQGQRAVGGRYVVKGKRRVAFRLGDHDARQPLTIDPVLVYSSYLGGDGGVTGGNDYGRGIGVDGSGNIYVAGATESVKFPTTKGAFQTALRDSQYDRYMAKSDAFLSKLEPGGSALVYSTYLGGDGVDEATGLAVDAAGNAWMTGFTQSGNFPVTAGAAQRAYGGSRDAFVSKLDPSGALVFSTLLGGESTDTAYAIAVDSSGNSYVTGETYSSKFPTTAGALQTTIRSWDAFVTKLNPDGTALVYSTYLGGASSEKGLALAVDGSGEAYVAGTTYSSDFPTSADALKKTLTGADAFVAKLNETGTALEYSTLFGGTGTEAVNGITVDGAGNAYMTGQTDARNLPVTKDAAQAKYGGGSLDAFLAKLNDKGTALLYCTYLGGSGRDAANAIGLASAGNVFVAGQTDSKDFPVSAKAFQSAYGGGALDAFVVELGSKDLAVQYSSYLGGDGDDRALALAVDPAGSAHLTGQTSSANFPTTPGAFQTALALGGFDAFVTKLDPSGAALGFSTYLGGSGFSRNEEAFDIAVDADGNAYVTGRTYSANFPVTAGAVQTSHGGGTFSDAFVTKIDAGGKSLVYSTYLGGNGEDSGTGIAVGPDGSAYVTGTTASSNFPTTKGAFQTAPGGSSDAFVAKLSPDGSTLAYSTLLGGNGTDAATGIAVGSDGNAYLTGTTSSGNFPTTNGALQTSGAGGLEGFVSKLNGEGSALVYSTYLGGDGQDNTSGIAVDSEGNAYVTGWTYSKNFPTTAGAYQTAFAGGYTDAFVSKLDANGAALRYSTLLGGASDDDGRRVAVDSSGSAYVTGRTNSSNFPTTPEAFQGSARGGYDGYVAKLNAEGTALAYSTYLGGSGSDWGAGLAVDSSGSAYVTGLTNSANFPTSADRIQRTRRPGWEAFVVKLDAAGKGLLYSSYLGGVGDDIGAAIAVDPAGNAYVTGQSGSADFRTTPEAFQQAAGNSNNPFVAKIDFSQPTPVTPPPVISNVVDVARQSNRIAPGAIMEIQGQRLARSTAEFAKILEKAPGPLPLSLGGTTVAAGTVTAPLFSVSPEKIIAQMPDLRPGGGTSVVVSVDGEESSPFGVNVPQVAIGILGVYRTDLSVITAENRARGSDSILVYVTGTGNSDPPVPVGTPAPADPPARLAGSPMVKIAQPGYESQANICEVESFTLAPGLVGVAQVRVRLSADTSMGGDWSLWITAAGSDSNKVPLYLIREEK